MTSLWYYGHIIVLSFWYHCDSMVSLWYHGDITVILWWYHWDIMVISWWYHGYMVIPSPWMTTDRARGQYEVEREIFPLKIKWEIFKMSEKTHSYPANWRQFTKSSLRLKTNGSVCREYVFRKIFGNFDIFGNFWNRYIQFPSHALKQYQLYC